MPRWRHSKAPPATSPRCACRTAPPFRATRCWSASARHRTMRWRARPGSPATTASSSISPPAPRIPPSTRSATAPGGRCRCITGPVASRACRMRWSRRSRPPPTCAAARLRLPEVPWFWSDQYEVRLQIAGLPFDVTETVVRGDPRSGSFAIFHLAGGRHRSGGRGGQRAGGVHGGTHDDRAAKAGGSGEAARRVMLDA